MENIKLNVKALAAMMNMSIAELASVSGIDYHHLRLISCGDATMSGEDLMNLSAATGVPPSNIDYTRRK